MESKSVTFYQSKDIELPFGVKIGALEGESPIVSFSEQVKDPLKPLVNSNINPYSDLQVTVRLYANSKPLTLPVSTSYKSFKTSRKWNEWLTLPFEYASLPLDAQLAITLWDYQDSGRAMVPYGGTTVRLFDPRECLLQRGRQKLKIWLGQAADGLANTKTPSTFSSRNELDRLEQLIKKHESGDMKSCEWLDNLAFRQIEKISRMNLSNNNNHLNTQGSDPFLIIELAQFDFPVVFGETEYEFIQYPKFKPTALQQQQYQTYQTLAKPEIINTGMGTTNTTPNTETSSTDSTRITKVYDPDMFRENLIEAKYRRLIRSHKTGPLDKELKPNAKMRDELNGILATPSIQELTDDEKNLLWKFRYYLTRDKRALTKFLKSISWSFPLESRQAVELLPRWAEIDVADALELLGPAFSNRKVRSYAVERLKKASDHELELYLLQLVQALKFEFRGILKKHNHNSHNSSHVDNGDGLSIEHSALAQFLIARAVNNDVLGNYFYWYVNVEAMDFDNTANSTSNDNNGIGNFFRLCLDEFMAALDETSLNTLTRQVKFIQKILYIAQTVKTAKNTRPQKVEQLRALLSDSKTGLLHFEPLPLPLDPAVIVNGCLPDECSVFKSSLTPLKITLTTPNGGTYAIMFKTGDDLRQDQLVIQLVNLMDSLLQTENVDLRLMPYRILATGPVDGALQFIPNQTLASVLTEHGTILKYLQKHNPDPSTELGVKAPVMETFVRSCAGYCVMTYLLGVGDRHLDNLLITPRGHFFHADFGYILGRDPKPFPPLMKLPIQIIDGMGGLTSANYDKFRGYCFTAYSTLRKSSNLILNLFMLMSEDSSIPDIVYEGGGVKAVNKIKDKLCTEMTEEQAMVHMQNLINDSVSAFLPMVIDRLHNLAQYWRA
ncbi:phosphatidylinositol 3-kinase [Nadsonia fulvescens var. elongata DSM 6958]|uniref:Phosphatidylinositol 3-kinase VPS34 n=1 Tax=Nadsonia fulvescens var. elongata DSM 6958 TaxID=857566 RepID=A0A1E3PF34_9ASCO|nr:phosphatidylinositol 3-kinase [Nadsonia fulvescens var. elongata DSM 6958]